MENGNDFRKDKRTSTWVLQLGSLVETKGISRTRKMDVNQAAGTYQGCLVPSQELHGWEKKPVPDGQSRLNSIQICLNYTSVPAVREHQAGPHHLNSQEVVADGPEKGVWVHIRQVWAR